MLDQIEAGFALLERFKRWRLASRTPADESIAGRFCRVFEAHGVHRNQIPRFFGHGLTVQDIQSDASLLPKLDDAVLDGLCERFSIRREWLDGADKKVHPTHRFYKSPDDFIAFITNLRKSNADLRLRGVVVAPADDRDSAVAVLVVEEEIGWVGEKMICRYHLCDDWPFSYWKARAYLTACVAIAWKQGVYVHGRRAASKDIGLLTAGENLMGWDGEGLWAMGPKQWDPEDMALRPDAFLSGIDPERDNFGIRSALQLWLKLQEDGFMDTGLSMYEGTVVRGLFQSEFEKFP